MMRPIIVKAPVAKAAASTASLAYTAAGAELTWTDPTPPDVVSTWGNPKNEVGWYIMRAPLAFSAAGKPSVGKYSQVGTALANATAWTDNKVQPGVYTYMVVAWNAAGNTDSNEVGFPTIPDTPGALAVSYNAKSVTLSWTKPFDGWLPLKGYQIELKSGNSWINPISVGAGVTQYTFPGLTPGTTYYYRIVAINALGSSLPGLFPAATVPSVPIAPTGLKAVAGVKSATASWTAVPDTPGVPVLSYQLGWAQTATGPWTMKTISGTPATATTPWVPPATTWTANAWTTPAVAPFVRGQRVFFRVAAVNVIGAGPSAQTTGFVTVQ